MPLIKEIKPNQTIHALLQVIVHRSKLRLPTYRFTVQVWFDFFVLKVSTFEGYLIPEPSLQKNARGTIQSIARR